MNIFSFGFQFTDEVSCCSHFKIQRDKEVAICKKSGFDKYYWLANKSSYTI